MIPFLLILSVLCLSGYFIVYSMSPPDHATVTGTRTQDEAAFLTAERGRFDELVADLGLQVSGTHQDRYTSADRHSVNTITSDALDALYAERDRLREQLDRAPHQATDPADDLAATVVEQTATAHQPNIDALLDAYAHRGTVIQQALRLVDSTLDAPPVDAAGQRAVQDFAHKVRSALLSAAGPRDK